MAVDYKSTPIIIGRKLYCPSALKRSARLFFWSQIDLSETCSGKFNEIE